MAEKAKTQPLERSVGVCNGFFFHRLQTEKGFENSERIVPLKKNNLMDLKILLKRNIARLFSRNLSSVWLDVVSI